MSGEFCNANCIHFREDYELVGDEEVNMTVCALGHTEIYNRAFCEDYQLWCFEYLISFNYLNEAIFKIKKKEKMMI